MPGILGDIGLDVMDHGPGGLGLAVPVDANKKRSASEGRHGRIELKPGCSRFLSLSSPTSPVATLHKWYYSPVATLHKRHYPPPHAPAISGSNEVLHLVSDSGDFWAARAVFVGVFPS
jgi:hypothetical protein